MTRILKTLSTTFIVSAALIAPVSAQYAPAVPAPGYYAPPYGYGPVYGPPVVPPEPIIGPRLSFCMAVVAGCRNPFMTSRE